MSRNTSETVDGSGEIFSCSNAMNITMIELVSKRLIIRPFVTTDLERFQHILCDAEVMKYSDAGPLSEAEASRWVARQIKNYSLGTKFGRWAITIPGNSTAIGYIGLTQHKDRAWEEVSELGFRLARKNWGNGYALEAARMVVTYAFEHTASGRVIAIVDPHNLPSIRVVEELGMSFHELIMFDGYDYPDRIYACNKPTPLN